MTIRILVIGGVLSLLLGKSCEVWVPPPNTEHVQVPGEASSLSEQELVNEEKIFGPEHPDKVMKLNNQAMLYYKDHQGRSPSSATSLPQLPETLAKLVAQDEKRLDQVMMQHDPMKDAKVQTLIQMAEAALHIRTKYQGEQWWETIDARHRLMDLKKWLTLMPAQRTDLAEAEELRQHVWILNQEGKYQEGLISAAKRLDIERRIWGERHRNVAWSLNDLAGLYLLQGNSALALPLLKRALAISEQARGPTHPDTAQSLNNLAELYRAQGQYAEAEPLFQRALAINERALGPTHPDTALSLNNLAVQYWAQGQYAEAEPLLQRALAIREQARGPTHPDTARSLNSLAVQYWAQGQYAEAEPLLQRALAINERARGPTHPDTAQSLNNLAVLHQAQGQYTEAEPLLQRALAIREAELGPTHPDTALSLNNLATLYQAQGQYTEAEPLSKRALAIREAELGPTHPDTAQSLNNLAELYRDRGQYAEAEPLFQRALAINERALGPTHPHTAISLNNLAILYQAQGQYAEAEPLFQRALAIREQARGPTHPDTAQSLDNLAILYQAQGQYAEAEPLSKRALAINERALGPTHPDTAISYENLGILRAIIEPDGQAAEWLHQSVQAQWQFLTKNFTALTRRQQQQLLSKSGLGKSDGYLWHVLSQVPTMDRAVGYQVTLLSKYLLTEAARQGSSAVQRLVAEAPAEWQATWREWEALRRAYATQAVEVLQDTNALRPTKPDIAAAPPRALVSRMDELEQRLRREHPAYAQEAKLQEITVEQVQHALKPDQVLLEYVQFHPYDERTKQLAATMHYGVYVVRGPQTPVIAVDLGDSAPIYTAILQFQKEMQRAEGYAKAKVDRSQKQVRTAEAELAQASSTLRQLVWQPVEHLLTHVTRVYVAPDGPLSAFPFEALAQRTTSGAWQYLVEERELVYLNTGRDLARLALTAEPGLASSASARTAVLIGNPKFNARPKDVARVVAGLPHTTSESRASSASGARGTLGSATSQDGFRVPRNWDQIQALDTLLTQADQQLRRTGWTVTTWRDRQAVEPAALQVQAPQILQFATHGYLLERATPEQTGNWDNPLLRSMLMMAGVNHATPEQTVFYRVGNSLLTEAEAQQRQLSSEARQQARIDIGDGVLTAYEVSGMNLQGTELVNLTACKTGLGEITPDGVMGLRQAFFFAGARSLTTSLWEVPVNEATQQIGDFYQRWLGATTKKKGRTPNTRYAAFRETQLAALAQTRKTYGAGHPFFWAGFIYLGDPGDLSREDPGMRKAASNN